MIGGIFGQGVARASNILRQEGTRALLHALAEAVRQRLGYPSPARQAYLSQKAEADAQFDSVHGVDTAGVQHLYGLTIEGGNAAFGVNHIATDPHDFAQAIAQLDIDPNGAAFVDLGAGKARALIMAAAHPFRSITGVEFAHELFAAGQDNIAKAAPQLDNPARISMILGDAAQFDLPDGPVVLYLFNPFGGVVIEEVARRTTEAAKNRIIRLIYMNPVRADAWTALGWAILTNERAYAIFAPPA
jgi:hypothetical protein